MKRVAPPKTGKVISVVKAGQEVSLEVPTQKDLVVHQEEEIHTKKSRAHSRSRRRSRSKARARALSAPEEKLGVQAALSIVMEVEKASSQNIKASEVEGQVVDAELKTLSKSSVSREVHLEEGEIGGEVEKEEVSSVDSELQEKDSIVREEEEALWFTKHSKNYRCALRQESLWRASGSVGSPPKTFKFLNRGNVLAKKHGF
ncbi:Uncharacterized protein Rs2_10176 [Raphanus sativus]|nr:Uncharacterized protein Rs2_10176 [Raphanus sativus]